MGHGFGFTNPQCTFPRGESVPNFELEAEGADGTQQGVDCMGNVDLHSVNTNGAT